MDLWRRYSWKTFRADLLAGLTVAAVAVPQAMAYALIAGVEPRYGLYTAIVMTAIGAIFNSSAHLINGPTNAISLVVLSAVAGLGVTGAERVEAVFLLSVLVGIMQLLLYLIKMGDLTRYISESVILGFMLGAGVLIALSQIPNLLGIDTYGEGDDHLLLRLGQTVFYHGATIQPLALAIGCGTAAVVIALRALGKRLGLLLPDMLVALILSSIVSHLCGWREEWPEFPAALPTFHIPQIQWTWVRGLAGSALALSVLGLLEALAIAKSLAVVTRQSLDYNRQCLAEGIANLGGGFFQCIPGSGSLTRSAINHQAGAMTQISGLLSAAAVALCVVLFADLARYVPRPALAGILLVTAWRLVDRKRLYYCWQATRFDRNIALATAGVAVFLSIEFSVLIGVFLSFFFFVPRVSRLRVTEMILSKERVIREREPDDPRCARVVILSLEGELFFGAAPELDQILADLYRRTDQGVRVIVLRLKRTRNPDMVCMERMQHFLHDMESRGVVVLLCGVRPDFARALERLGFPDWLPADRIFLEEAPPRPVSDGDSRIEGPGLSSTLRAIKRGYEILGNDLCPCCPRRNELELEKGWYYMI